MPEAAKKALEILNNERSKIDSELDQRESNLAAFQLYRETIDFRIAAHVKLIQSIYTRLQQAPIPDTPSVDGVTVDRNTQLAIRPGRSSARLEPPERSAARSISSNKRQRSGSLDIPLTSAQRAEFNKDFGEDMWEVELGRGQQGKGIARGIDPPGCTEETLKSAFFVARLGAERVSKKTKLLYAEANDLDDQAKADVVAGRSVSCTIGRRGKKNTLGR